MKSAVSGFVYVSRSMRPHQGHHTAPMSRRTGRFRALARWKASSLHGYQSTGWPIARLRYGECSSARWLGLACATAQEIHPENATSTNRTLSLMRHETQENQQSFRLGEFLHLRGSVHASVLDKNTPQELLCSVGASHPNHYGTHFGVRGELER